MKVSTPRALPALLVAGMLVAGAGSGAVAAAMITGANIKDGTVTGADVKNGSLSASELTSATRNQLRGINRYSVHQEKRWGVAPGVSDHFAVLCPSGTVVLGASGYWMTSTEAVQVVLNNDGSGAAFWFTNHGSASDSVYGTLMCAKAYKPSFPALRAASPKQLR